MKAMLLAAGKSSRLPEACRYGSKVLVPVRGQTLLERNLRYLRRSGIREAVINLCHGKKAILAFLKRKRMFGMKLLFSFEKEPLGTAGGVKKAQKYLAKGDFLVLYADNLCDFDLKALLKIHRARRALGTLGVFHPARAVHSGIFAGTLRTGPEGIVEAFVEKRGGQRINDREVVNAGVALFSPRIFRRIPSGKFCDFARHVYPKLLRGRKGLFAVEGASYVLASDTPKAFKRTRRLAAKVL
ncbi:MAG: nucleotidyltransferase family protein [Candidatus Omnitrophica bacterium]|nr:nucleotidyltransferase family protein [Candidatus Omnitrophota bacterium]